MTAVCNFTRPLQCVQKKRDKNIFRRIFRKTRAILLKFSTWYSLNKFATKPFISFPPQMNNVSRLPYET